MRYAKDHKAATREKIVEEAARQFRQHGIDGVSVPALMKEIGLTHGGFYAHFASKDALAAEAIASGMVQANQRLSELIDPNAVNELRGFVDAYLSSEHRDEPESGCALAALSAEGARQSEPVRAEMRHQVETSIARMAAIAKPVSDLTAEEVAAGTLASVVGAIVLSRMCRDDAGLSDTILSSSRRLLAAAERPAD